ncbi:hypothetical protein TNIN_191311 [Trichonephila inaurata madagascariensis]|uniref:Uncharacterized protein n=1 Tax=Trichonephila inaurata madagascariensis TaxID=2747483 RepID=A0A8X6XAH7_9ARAC|nr:hypothetical protein TNIN_191311 [Trichonephila inaurata madagascariensis]
MDLLFKDQNVSSTEDEDCICKLILRYYLIKNKHILNRSKIRVSETLQNYEVPRSNIQSIRKNLFASSFAQRHLGTKPFQSNANFIRDYPSRQEKRSQRVPSAPKLPLNFTSDSSFPAFLALSLKKHFLLDGTLKAQ